MAEKKAKQKNLIEVISEDLNTLKSKISKRGTKVKGKEEQADRPKLFAVIGFVLGILSAGAWLIPLLGISVSIAGIILNLLGLRAENGRWFAVAGMTLSIFFLNVVMLYSFYMILISVIYGG